MRSISESGGRRRQARDKRKKALPVRKLLELERAQQEARSLTQLQQQQLIPAQHHEQKASNTGRISCEKCGDKIETSGFVDHIRQCVGGSGQSMRAGSKSSTPSPSVAVPKSEVINGSGRKTPKSNRHQSNPSPRASPMSVGSANGSDAPASVSTPAPAPSSTPTKADGSPSVLNAIEKLIEKSFDAGQGASGGKAKAASNNPTGSNILRRLGIDESLDYSKPLMDPLMTVNMLRLYGYGQVANSQQRERTTSEASSSNASAVASNGDHSSQQATHQRDSGKSTPRSANGGSPLRSRSPSQSPSGVANRRRRKDPSPSPASPGMDGDVNPSSPAASSVVSERSLRSNTPATQLSSPDVAGRRSQSQTPTDVHPARSSLNALSSMFEGLSSVAAAPSSGAGTSSGGGGFNPLAALQKLCDKTETHSPSSTGRPNSLGGAGSSAGGSSGSGGGGGSGGGSGSSAGSSAGTNPGAILAFSWACNDAVMTDSIMKCAFCDTQFISKGAYRHHLSKMHFVKDAAGGSVSAPALKGASSGGSSSAANSANAKNSSASGGGANAASAAASPQPPAGANSFENESPHSKFLKYTELAKQLSSKYV